MKNILIITTTRENQGCSVAFVKSIDDIVEEDLREMIKNAIEKKEWGSGDLWSNYGRCGSDRGYVFSDYSPEKEHYPLTVEHIVEYVF